MLTGLSSDLLKTMSQNFEHFSCVTRTFYIELVDQFKKRFDLKDPIFDLIAMVEVKNALSSNPPTLDDLFERFPFLNDDFDRQAAEREWRSVALIQPSGIDCLTQDQVWSSFTSS